MSAPVVPALQRNRLGIAALVLALIVVALPLVSFMVFVIASIASGAVGDNVIWAVIGGFFVSFLGVYALASPVAIAALVLGIVAVTRRDRRKVQAVIAIVLSVVPALGAFGLPAAIDYLF